MVFQRFHEIHYKSRAERSFDDFVDSGLYTTFVKFGSFIVNAKPLYADKYIDYVIKSGFKVELWTADKTYEDYVRELIKIEPAEAAIQRTVKTMLEWSDKNNIEWTDYFEKATSVRVVHDVKEGLVSPWVMYHTRQGKAVFQRMNDEQLALVAPFIDPEFWKRKFKSQPADVEFAKTLIKETQIK